jgi:hypothetical protein
MLARMLILWEGQIRGTFVGYQPGRIHAFPDGSYWVQVSGTVEPAQIKGAWAVLVRDEADGAAYLDVAGMNGCVEVRRVGP